MTNPFFLLLLQQQQSPWPFLEGGKGDCLSAWICTHFAADDAAAAAASASVSRVELESCFVTFLVPLSSLLRLLRFLLLSLSLSLSLLIRRSSGRK